jgi:hypothetical protein
VSPVLELGVLSRVGSRELGVGVAGSGSCSRLQAFIEDFKGLPPSVWLMGMLRRVLGEGWASIPCSSCSRILSWPTSPLPSPPWELAEQAASLGARLGSSLLEVSSFGMYACHSARLTT